MKKALVITLFFALYFSSSIIAVSGSKEISCANESDISLCERYLIYDKGIDEEKIFTLSENELRSLVQQVKAYNFSSKEIEDFIDGYPAIRKFLEAENQFRSSSNIASIDEDGNFITKYGIVPNRFKNYSNPINENDFILEEQLPNYYGLRSYSGNYKDLIDSSDQTGVFWVVESEGGFTSATSYVELPSVNQVNSIDRPYMFFAANTNPSSIIGDYGVVYYPNRNAWACFRNAGAWTGSRYNTEWEDGPLIPNNLRKLYFHIEINNTSSTDTITMTIRDGNNFSNVIWATSKRFYNNPINSSASNLNLYKEVTMAQHLANGILNTNTGTNVYGAKFSQSYLYNRYVTEPWKISNVRNVYRKAPSSNALQTVSPNVITKWSEDITNITFNRR